MSRIGLTPVYLNKDVEVSVTDSNDVVVKGPKATLTVPMDPSVEAQVQEGRVEFRRKNDHQQTRSYHGLYRALVQNAVTGVSQGWTRELELNGVGYRAVISGKNLELNLGYSHPVNYTIPEGVDVQVEKQTKVIVSGASREKVGQVAAKIRGFRPPEPFLGKGIKYVDEKIRRKTGKSGGK